MPPQLSKICTASRARLDLRREVARAGPRELVEQRVRVLRRAVQQLLGVRVVLASRRPRPRRSASSAARPRTRSAARDPASALLDRAAPPRSRTAARLGSGTRERVDRRRRAHRRSRSSGPHRGTRRRCPSPGSVIRMSQNRIAASKPNSSIGCSVTSHASSGFGTARGTTRLRARRAIRRQIPARPAASSRSACGERARAGTRAGTGGRSSRASVSCAR